MKPTFSRMNRRLLTVVVMGAAAMAFSAGVASATTASATGSSDAAARQNFVNGAQRACKDRGGLQDYQIIGTYEDGGEWTAEGTYECNR